MNLFDSRAARVLMTALAFFLCLGFVWIAWRTLIAFIFAILFAYLLEAPVEYFEARFKNHGRTYGILITYLALFGTLAVLLAIFGPKIAEEAQTLAQQLPGLSDKLSNGQLVHVLGERRGWSYETEQRIQDFLTSHRGQIVGAVSAFSTRALSTVQRGWWLFLVPILAIFFLKDGRRFGDAFVGFFERPQYKRVLSILLSELNQMIGHFMRAQLALTALAMAVLTVAFVVMRVPYSFALGPIAGAFEFIPVVGPIAAGAIVLGVAFAANYPHLLWLFILLLIWRGIQDYVASPRIMGGKLELHPLAVLFGVLAGAEVGGVIGVFLSIPILAAIKIIWRTYHQYRREIAVPEHDLVTTPNLTPAR